MRTYLEVPVGSVDADTRWRVRVALDVAEAKLGLPPIDVVWVIPAPAGYVGFAPAYHRPSPVGGWISEEDPERIFIRADLPARAMRVALHEARHAHQIRRPADFPTDTEALENDAEAWALGALQSTVSIPERTRP